MALQQAAALWSSPTGFLAGEAVSAVIQYQTLRARSWARHRIPLLLQAVRPPKLPGLLQVAEAELRQTSAQGKSILQSFAVCFRR